MFRIAAVVTFLVLAVVFTSSIVVGAKVDRSITCYDYSDVFNNFNLKGIECTGRKLLFRIKNHFRLQNSNPDTKVKCRGGLGRELMALTNTTGQKNSDAKRQLQSLCDDALLDASIEAAMISPKSTWGSLNSEPHSINLEEFFEGKGYLNKETGNFQQDANDFLKRGGHERFNYIGNDPRENDHYSTSDASYHGGEAILQFYTNEARSAFLEAPTADFQKGCNATNAAVCCWQRDRQYFDKNGNCARQDCAKSNPGDNTDVCWTEVVDDTDSPYPYPGGVTEQDLHCHGMAWSTLEDTSGDVNANARWNNLFFVSMYDHLYTRGYAESITDDPLIAGEQAMCGCVEDMSAVIARADCTEAVGRTNYTASLDDGKLVIEYAPDTFRIQFRACEGFNYDDSISPKQYDEEYSFNSEDAGLDRSDNDLSAFVFRQYLEGKIDKAHVSEYEKTIVGYRNTTVNESDEERNKVCEEKFKLKFPGIPYVENVTTVLQ